MSDSSDTASSSGSSGTTSSSQSLQSQIQTAILSALETAEQSGDSTNFQTVIKNAVDQTLQANGITVNQSQQQTEAGDSGLGGTMEHAAPATSDRKLLDLKHDLKHVGQQ